MRRSACLAILGLLALVLIGGCSALLGEPALPRNVILFIGDGMGPEQANAASLYATGEEDALFFQNLPIATEITTGNVSGEVTDSAAAATALATGRKVQNGAIAVELPGSGADLQTILELARSEGRATGIVTTTFVTHATPAAFAAHVPSRSQYADIAADYLSGSHPNVIFGGGANGSVAADYEAAGYTVATNVTELNHAAASGSEYVAALIGDTHLPYV